MATLKPVIVPAKALKGGIHKLRISVAHNGEVRYIVTDILLNSPKELSAGQIVKRPDAAFLNTKLRGLMQKYQTAIEQTEYVDGLSCAQLVYMIKNGEQRQSHTLTTLFADFMSYKNIKEKTRILYGQYFKSITDCLGDIPLRIIDRAAVNKFQKWLQRRKLSNTTMRNRIAFFSAILSYARRCGYVQFLVDPFLGCERPRAEVRHAWLTVEQVKAIRDYPCPTLTFSRTIDMFMLSYYLGGMNIVDICKINFKEAKGYLKYRREKVARRVSQNECIEFEMPREAKDIVKKYMGPDGKLILPTAVHNGHSSRAMSMHLKIVEKELGIDRLIYYSARKSFAQHAYELGIDTRTIDYILGHSQRTSGSCLYHYITNSPALATAAIRKVLDNLK